MYPNLMPSKLLHISVKKQVWPVFSLNLVFDQCVTVTGYKV